MKYITKNIILFSIVATVLTIVFRFLLSKHIGESKFNLIWVSMGTYGVLMFITGWVFGKRDRKELKLYDVGFRFHFATFLICNIIAELWVALKLNAQTEPASSIHYTAIIWGIALLIHFGFFLRARKNSIKGVKKSELFE